MVGSPPGVKSVAIRLTAGIYLLTYVCLVQGQEYLLAFHGYVRPIIRVVTSDQRGVIDVVNPANVSDTTHVFTAEYERHTVELDPALFTKDGVENKAVIVRVRFNSQISLFGSDFYRSFFTPLQVKDLGSNYLISTCKQTSFLTEIILILATPSWGSQVNITFNSDKTFTHQGKIYGKGDAMVLSLSRYQTFTMTISADISGTVVTSTRPIAVYVGNVDPLDQQRLSYDQLFPVNLFGKEYVVPIFANGTNEISVISLYDTTMLYKGTDYVLEKNAVHRTSLTGQHDVYIKTDKPSLVLLCYTNSYPYTSLIVVPPYNAYVKKCTLPILETPQYRIITRNPVGLQAKGSSSLVVPVNWVGVFNSTFYTGTFTVSCFSVVVCESQTRFAFMFLEENLIYGFHCGYNFSSGEKDDNVTYAAPSTTTLSPDVTTPDPCLPSTGVSSMSTGHTSTLHKTEDSTVPGNMTSTVPGSTTSTTIDPEASRKHSANIGDNNDDDMKLKIGLGVGIPLAIIIIIVVIICVVVKKKKRRRAGVDQPLHEAVAGDMNLRDVGIDNVSAGSRDSSVRYAEIDPDYEQSYFHVRDLNV